MIPELVKNVPKAMLKLTIKRKNGEPIIMWFENMGQIQVFEEFIKELIESVKEKERLSHES